MSDTPYIHTFRTSEQCYVYDVNTDRILTVPESVYGYLSNPCNSDVDETVMMFVDNMKSSGFLRSDRVEISEHPVTPLLPYYLQNKMQQLILQVTQNCNLRCSYCIYSGSYKTRTHSRESMSFEVAERAIDFFVKRTKDSKNPTVAFYGGEPLLNFDLIKHCVNYINTQYWGRKIGYAVTTNGTLFDDNSVSFFVENEFKILISLDGPEEIHDTNRRFVNTGEGSFSTIMDNVTKIKKIYPNYYQDNVRFNAVLDTRQNFSCVNDFVCGKQFGEGKFNVSYITSNYTDQEVTLSEEFYIDREYEFFKFLLSKLGEISSDKVSTTLSGRLYDIYLACFKNVEVEQERIPSKFHHSGPCIPGARRLFVSTDGGYFPCERVSELSEVAVLGDIETGISLEKASRILNLEEVTHSRCKDCWAYRHCLVCIAHADDMHSISDTENAKKCPPILNSIDAKFKDYCVLRELEYTFDEERG